MQGGCTTTIMPSQGQVANLGAPGRWLHLSHSNLSPDQVSGIWAAHPLSFPTPYPQKEQERETTGKTWREKSRKETKSGHPSKTRWVGRWCFSGWGFYRGATWAWWGMSAACSCPWTAGYILSQDNACVAGVGDSDMFHAAFPGFSELRLQSLPRENLFFRANDSLLLFPFSPRMTRGRITSSC